jgi:DUF1680 family protein
MASARSHRLILLAAVAVAALGCTSRVVRPARNEAVSVREAGPFLRGEPVVPAAEPARKRSGLSAVPFHEVEIRDAFWSARIETNRRATIEACLAKCEETGRIANFARAGGLESGEHQGYLYNDSDVYKVLEGIAYTLRSVPDPELERRADRIIAKIAAAQRPDGYLNTYVTLKRPDQRWKNIRHGHELYCAGHLIEAAVAYRHATQKRELLDVAVRFADLIDREFGPGKRLDPPGHQELELALLRLAREVPHESAQRYRRLAAFFVDQRGSAAGREPFGEYAQDHLPVREQREVAGHAVRAMYLYCAMADLAALDGDPQLVDALESIWRDVVERKMYLTGGIGPSASNEGFTVPFDLPNDSAYAETCAAIGMALWNQRMLLAGGEARFADVVERELYNGLLSGVSLCGERFFYDNPLGSRGDHHRVPWFDCSCCPTNLVRYLPAIGERVYAHRGDELYVAQYVGSQADVRLDSGTVAVRQETDYPWSGRVRIHVDVERSMSFTMRLRLPGWCRQATVITPESTRSCRRRGPAWIDVARTWNRGDEVVLLLDMPVERVYADPRVEADRGRVALQRGPVVFCAEGVDNGGHARNLALPRGAPVEARFEPALFGGAVTLRGRALALERGGDGERRAREVDFTAVPYHLWDNREGGEMVVWLPESPELAELPGEGAALERDGVRASASHCWRGDTLAALLDGLEPRSSGDHDLPRMTFWDHRGTREWVQYEFASPRRLAGSAVYWFDDTGRGACRLPESWSLSARIDGAWRPLEPVGGSGYPVDPDRFCAIRFEPVETDTVRLEVKLQEGFSGGVLEWRVDG